MRGAGMHGREQGSSFTFLSPPSAILLAQSSLCPWPTCSHITYTLIYTRARAHTSLPDASPPEQGIPDYGPSAVAAKVTSQASASPFQILSPLPLPKGAPHPQASCLQAGPQDCSGKGCYQDPPMAPAMAWPPALLVS